MFVSMMRIREVGVGVRDRIVAMRMAVAAAVTDTDTGRDHAIMRMLMVHIMGMRMVMFDHFMRMLVRVTLGQMQPDSHRHAGAGKQ